MVRRTGMFEAPANVVSVQRVASPVGDTSGVWEGLTRVASQASQALQPLKNQQAERQAQRDFADGRVGLRLQLNAEDELYNNAMTQSYLLATSRDLDQRILELETEHAADAQGFATAFQGVRSAAIATAPNDLAPHLEQLLNARETETMSRIGERVRNAGVSAYAQNAAARLQQLEARLTGYDDVNSPEYQAAFSEYERVGSALTSNPLSGVTAEEWDFRRNNTSSRLMADQVGRTAEQMYIDGGANAESARSATAYVEQHMNDPSLVLTEAQRDASFAEARRRINAMETERRRAERELAAQIRAYRSDANNEARDLISGAEQLAQSFVVIPDDQIAEMASAVAASGSASRAREFNELAIENAVRGRLQGLSQVEIEGEMRRFREAAATGDSDAAIALQEAERYRSNLRRVDPVTGLQMHYGETPASLQNGLGPRIRQMESYSERVGRAETNYFTPGERQLLAGRLAANDEESLAIVRGLIGDAAAERGNGHVRATRMMSEIADAAGPEWAAIGNVYLRGGEASTNTARLMQGALRARQSEGNRRAALRPPSMPDNTESSIIESVLGVQGRSLMSPEELAQVRLSADLAYEGRALNDPAAYATPNDYRRAYQGAVQAVLGAVNRPDANGQQRTWGGVASTGRTLRGETEFGSRTMDNAVVVPNWVRRDQFPTVYQSLRMQDFAAGSDSGLTPSGGTVDDWRRASLVPTGRRVGEYYLLDANGARYMVGSGGDRRPYVLDLNRIRASLAERRSDAVIP